MADSKQINMEEDVVKLFGEYGANLIQMVLFYKNMVEPEKAKPEVLAFTDLEGLEKIAEGTWVGKDGIETRNYTYFGMDSDNLIIQISRAHNLPSYELVGFKVEREGYTLGVAAFKDRESK